MIDATDGRAMGSRSVAVWVSVLAMAVQACAHESHTAYSTVAATDEEYAATQACVSKCDSDGCLRVCGLDEYPRVSCADLAVATPRYICVDLTDEVVGYRAREDRGMVGGALLYLLIAGASTLLLGLALAR